MFIQNRQALPNPSDFWSEAFSVGPCVVNTSQFGALWCVYESDTLPILKIIHGNNHRGSHLIVNARPNHKNVLHKALYTNAYSQLNNMTTST